MPEVRELELEVTMDSQGAVKGSKKVNKATKGIAEQAGKSTKTMKKFTDFLKKNWLGVAAVVTGVTLAIKKAFNFAKTFQEYRQGMDALARNTGQNSDKIVKKLAEVTEGTVANRDVMLAANRLVALNVTKDTDKMAQLFEIARVKAKAMGISTSQAISDISTGIGRASPLILDNLGIITKGWDKEAKAAGKAMDSQFILNKILRQGAVELEAAGAKVVTGAEKFQQFTASMSNLGLTIGKVLTPALLPLLGIFTKITGFISSAILKIAGFISKLAGTRAELQLINEEMAKPVLLRLNEKRIQTLERGIELTRETIKADRERIDLIKEEIGLLNQNKISRDKLSEATINALSAMKGEKNSIEGINQSITDNIKKINERKQELIDLTKVVREQSKVKPPELTPPPEKVEESKASIADFYTFLDDQRELNLLKEQEAFIRAKEGLDLALEEDIITKQEHALKLEEMKNLHEFNITEIERKSLDERWALDKAAINRFDKAYKDLTVKQKAELDKMLTAHKSFADDITSAMNTAVGNVTSDFASGMADMIVEGKRYGKSFGDIIKDLIKQVAKLIVKLLIVKGIKAGLTGGLGLLFGKGGRVPRMDVGGSVVGGSHSQGGVNINAEGGEYMIRKSRVTSETLPVLMAINNGVSNLANLLPVNVGRKYQEGGMVTNDNRRSESRIINIENVNIEDPDPDKIFNTVLDKAEEVGKDLIG